MEWRPAGVSIQTNQCPPPPSQFFTSQMPFLPPNQQCQSTEGKYYTLCILYTENSLNFVLAALQLFFAIRYPDIHLLKTVNI